MFRDAIPGMDKVFQTEPPEGSVILIIGNAGTLKSAFTYNLISNDLTHRQREFAQCIYVTLEEKKESLLRNCKTMGILPSEKILISDLATFLRAMENWKEFVPEEKDYLGLILEKASRPFKILPSNNFDVLTYYQNNISKEKAGAKDELDPPTLTPEIFVLDSLNALNSLVYNNSRNIRKEMGNLIYKLREEEVTSFLIMETGDPSQYRPENFLADGIIELGMMETDRNKFKRYLKVRKMRSTRHSIEPFLIEVTENGIAIVEELI